MEQRRGSSSQPLEGAGFDPAFIPGLTAPVSGEPEDVRRDEADADVGTGVEADGVADAVPPARESAEESAETDEEEAAPVDGPVFEAADRRARIVADHKGVRLSLDDQSCEFRWDEVGAVETETGRFGKRFTVTVHTPDRRWYPIEIEATSRSRFAEWESALDEVLDAYFEDDEPDSEPDSESESDPEPEATADAEPDAKTPLAKSDAESDSKSGGKPAADGEE
ncbi:hypothetical protein ABVB69_23515 [Streptomyces sp. NPDC000349]|uniref:hypothetical protein n=1 Tax=unclassified Streptomyces TaxID=2593676 RepID=UPI00277E68F0|nr:hypothetical protein [Streptomyces sp. DSM 40167]MDQ0406050.1 hypothetical protein [Streptomyces sp. DSM 40167]